MFRRSFRPRESTSDFLHRLADRACNLAEAFVYLRIDQDLPAVEWVVRTVNAVLRIDSNKRRLQRDAEHISTAKLCECNYSVAEVD